MSASYLEPGPLKIPFATGEVIADKYEVVGVLGAGGVAYVIAAIHRELGEMVALKFLRPESLAYEDVVARFASEARAVARIKSEHVAHVLDVGSLPDGTPFIVMEYLEGKDLADVLGERRRLSVKVSVDYVLQACEALACAHAAGIVHRDIKPENLFLMQQAGSVEIVKVLDFGISKSVMAAVETHGRKAAKTTLPMGTPGYMSPEQIRACGNVDARTDIWALGCVLSELLTGKSTFEAPTQVQLGAVILERDPIPLRKLLPEAPPELEAIILRCLAKDPDDRFQDVAELSLALYPFGPRRSRLSAERCHQVLKGQQGVVIEFNSVPPPSNGDTPLPISSTDAVVDSAPTAVYVPQPLRTSTPATLNAIDVPSIHPRRRRLMVAGVVLASAVAGVALGFSTGFGRSRAPAAAVAPQAAPTLPIAAAPGAVIAPQATEARSAPPALAANADAGDAPDGDAPNAVGLRPSASSAAVRARQARAQRAAQSAREAAAAQKAKPAARRPGLDDAEPDVGY
jgi:serine/threonine-protein kinase